MANWRNAVEISQLKKRLTIHNEGKFVSRQGNNAGQQKKSESASHGGFDNNVEVISKTLERITESALALPVDDLVGF